MSMPQQYEQLHSDPALLVSGQLLLLWLPQVFLFLPMPLPQEYEQRAVVKELVDQLMGRNPELRFNFIQNNAGDMDREMIDA